MHRSFVRPFHRSDTTECWVHVFNAPSACLRAFSQLRGFGLASNYGRDQPILSSVEERLHMQISPSNLAVRSGMKSTVVPRPSMEDIEVAKM